MELEFAKFADSITNFITSVIMHWSKQIQLTTKCTRILDKRTLRKCVKAERSFNRYKSVLRPNRRAFNFVDLSIINIQVLKLLKVVYKNSNIKLDIHPFNNYYFWNKFHQLLNLKYHCNTKNFFNVLGAKFKKKKIKRYFHNEWYNIRDKILYNFILPFHDHYKNLPTILLKRGKLVSGRDQNFKAEPVPTSRTNRVTTQTKKYKKLALCTAVLALNKTLSAR
ncbi:hypothetical protein AGLY_013185 [Aphis glycines]|uniref:Uncharacterized protein n=1 Tax=Aphis glycines TaxID=307491 RepID=A0A6G0T5S1_APHGL|nr:hypothetical protein AGLY_013185 [Aphis glycines]